MTFTFKEHLKIVKIYMMKFNITISDKLKIMEFFQIKGYNM